jgi:ribosomal protein L11 methyltransferase
MRWAALTIDIGSVDACETAEQLFYNAGIKGIAVDDTAFPMRITGYLPEDERLAGRVRAIDAALTLLPTLGIESVSGRVSLAYVEEDDWANAWKKYFKPMRIGRGIVVLPPWEAPDLRPDDISIVIDPGMAFGTGSHATTQLCLQALEDAVAPGAIVADIGTGSGILAIAAAKLGASSVYAMDIDPQAVRIAGQNATVNSTVLELSEELPRGRVFNVVVANIIADTLIELSTVLTSLLAPAGILIASGIINHRALDVELAFRESGLSEAVGKTRDEWVVQIYHKQAD